MARSLNRVQLIGNLTRDPELRYTPSGNAVCSFSIATNRGWTTDSGEKKEETDFHRIVAWNKLAELCSQFLTKGRKVYVEGRLSTRQWQAQDGTQKTTTEVVIDDMILLDSRRQEGMGEEASSHPTYAEEQSAPEQAASHPASSGQAKPAAKKPQPKQEEQSHPEEETVSEEDFSDIPF